MVKRLGSGDDVLYCIGYYSYSAQDGAINPTDHTPHHLTTRWWSQKKVSKKQNIRSAKLSLFPPENFKTTSKRLMLHLPSKCQKRESYFTLSHNSKPCTRHQSPEELGDPKCSSGILPKVNSKIHDTWNDERQASWHISRQNIFTICASSSIVHSRFTPCSIRWRRSLLRRFVLRRASSNRTYMIVRGFGSINN